MKSYESFRRATAIYNERLPKPYTEPGTRRNFGLNSHLSGRQYYTIPDKSRTVMLYQGVVGPGELRTVVFVDGQIRRLTPSEWRFYRGLSRIR